MDTDDTETSSLSELTKLIEAVEEGTHETYRARVEQLEMQMEEKIRAARQYRDNQLGTVESLCDAEQKHSRDEFEAERKKFQQKLLQSLYEQQRRLMEERAPGSGKALEMNQRKIRRQRLGPSFPTSTTATRSKKPPVLPFMFALKDHEIHDDLYLIRKEIDVVNSSNRASGRSMRG
eukprot:gnl/Spiro4/13060_TR6929_c0_g1_i1.p1 gnl/Spiro4/13060_TR6929_c0_g1~~gnl/Spiro4/13060_TR6929_c0_g1_i1.p1  ORF type:complete len:196 (+),score=32.83 gnl/Spiro4/13060_TR6929_c0_g1_i1:58-588(+)